MGPVLGVQLSAVDNGKVAVQTDAHEQKDATVEVDMKNCSTELAEKIPKAPSIWLSGLCSPEGQRHQQQDVCNTQVEDEGV